MKDREEFLPWSSGNATTAATVKKKYQVSGFFKVSKYRQEKLSYFVEMSLHLVTCFLAIVNLIASTKYLGFKLCIGSTIKNCLRQWPVPSCLLFSSAKFSIGSAPF
jgi:hypothetical protein